MLHKSAFLIVFLSTIILVGCNQQIERSGVVIDALTNEPIPEVSIDIYLRNQRRDSLINKVYTDRNGFFHITEKRSKAMLFELSKIGYINHVSSLSVENDTIQLEKSTN